MCALWSTIVYREYVTPFIDDRSMNTTFYESVASLFARSGDDLSRDARTRTPHPWRRLRKSAVDPRWFLTCRWTGIYPLSLYLSLAPISLSLFPPLSFALIFCKPLNESPDHQTITLEQIASHRIASHRTASHHQQRSLSLLQTAYSPLLLGLLLTLSYPIIGYTRATPLLSTAFF